MFIPYSTRARDIAFSKMELASYRIISGLKRSLIVWALTATPIGIPKLRMNPYMQAAIARSSLLDIACVATLVPVRTIPFPTPNSASAPEQNARDVVVSKLIIITLAVPIIIHPIHTPHM
jgi:hypothetical protein